MSKVLFLIIFFVFSLNFFVKANFIEADNVYYNKALLSTLLLSKSIQLNSLLIPKKPNSSKNTSLETNTIIEIPKTPIYKTIN
jgi:hypothetical protein